MPKTQCFVGVGLSETTYVRLPNVLMEEDFNFLPELVRAIAAVLANWSGSNNDRSCWLLRWT